MHNILILCTGNSARSILGEALINHLGDGRFRGYSAGSNPKATPHPTGLRLLSSKGIQTSSFASKKWDVFAGTDAPEMTLIITVCDNANDEVCPIWPGHPCQVHWGLPDPAAANDEMLDAAFAATFDQLKRRITALLELDFDTLDAADLQAAAREIHAREALRD